MRLFSDGAGVRPPSGTRADHRHRARVVAQLPIEQSASVQIRLRGKDGGWVRTEIVAIPLAKPTTGAAPAIAVFTQAKEQG